MHESGYERVRKMNADTFGGNAAIFPEFFRPFQVPELVRLGRDFDGGYLVDKRSVKDADCLVGIGIGDDWSFEKDFRSRSRSPIIAIDATTSKWMFVRRHCRDSVKGFVKGLVGREVRFDPRRHKALLKDYGEFFRNENRHVRKYVAGVRDSKHITIDDIVDGLLPQDCGRFLLKIDIEGEEYGILDDIRAVSGRLTGLVMEFHDVPRRIDEISGFLARLPLSLCHIHCNNFCGTIERGLPQAIELSLTAHSVSGAHVEALPNALDQPNLPHRSEIGIAFE